MRYVNIPHTELNPSRVCLGSNRFGTLIKEPNAFALLDTFLEMGANFIDTAHIYADWIKGAQKSASEKTIGKWLKRSGNRDRVVLATKGGHPSLSTTHLHRMSKDEITRDLNDSLTNLQTEVIDLYWLHRDATDVPVEDIIEIFNDQVQAGKIRYFGCSNWSVERISAANSYAQNNDLQGFVASQLWWSLAQPNRAALTSPESQVVFGIKEAEFHRKSEMAIIPYSAQGKGFFSKLDKLGEKGLNDTDRDSFINDLNNHRSTQIKRLAKKYDVPVSHIVLSYLISQPFVTIPIIGSRTLDQLKDSLFAVNLILKSEEIANLSDPSINPKNARQRVKL
ncbi:MAG: aldo/keto reductase [Anaerolineae bacterium]|nr:aldo/keto reductase [Anaerolineae bacterium]